MCTQSSRLRDANRQGSALNEATHCLALPPSVASEQRDWPRPRKECPGIQMYRPHLSYGIYLSLLSILCRVLSPNGRKKHQQHTVLILECIVIKCEAFFKIKEMDHGGGILELHTQELKMPHTMIMQDFVAGMRGLAHIDGDHILVSVPEGMLLSDVMTDEGILLEHGLEVQGLETEVEVEGLETEVEGFGAEVVELETQMVEGLETEVVEGLEVEALEAEVEVEGLEAEVEVLEEYLETEVIEGPDIGHEHLLGSEVAIEEAIDSHHHHVLTSDLIQGSVHHHHMPDQLFVEHQEEEDGLEGLDQEVLVGEEETVIQAHEELPVDVEAVSLHTDEEDYLMISLDDAGEKLDRGDTPLEITTEVMHDEDSNKEGSEVIKVYIFKAEADDDVEIGE
ncbi:unnamed protein product [Oncorhynchus mykiss]|uniref:Transcriptional activator Zfx/Zfy domain-containing protein n=1 Tax=Oncorhynchus mykiss TaxID=8022 RepID=A0A060YQU2_ONCMY|nr:unnamed protein product [Oncorhynchus mykiss]